LTVMETFLEAVCCGVPLSLTCTVKLAVAGMVGVPLITAPDNVRPAGNAPDVTDQLSEPIPALAGDVCEYAAPTVAAARDTVVTVSVAGFTVSERGWDAVCCGVPLSLTCTVKLTVPAVVGVPLITAPDNVRPAGNAPDVTDQLSEP